jgi:hypothetical protein
VARLERGDDGRSMCATDPLTASTCRKDRGACR